MSNFEDREYLQRRFTPTRVGYEAAAFVRYRVPYGADQTRRIEANPTWQWGVQADEAAAYAEGLYLLRFGGKTMMAAVERWRRDKLA